MAVGALTSPAGEAVYDGLVGTTTSPAPTLSGKLVDGTIDAAISLAPEAGEKALRGCVKRARRITGSVAEAPRGGFGSGGFWNTIDDAVDPSVVCQLNPGSCGPACGAMLLRGTGNPAAQSAIALRQGAVMSDSAARLANAMNELAGTSGVWKGGFINVITNPRRVFSVLNRNGSFATTLRTQSMKVSHMVVVDGLDDAGRVIIRDPSTGTRYLMNWDDFVKVWEGKSVYR